MRPNDRLKAMAEAPLGGLLARFSWPALVSMTLHALYSVVDRIWIGHGCGQDAMAALTLAFPLMMVFVAFGVFAGVGHAALISIKLGDGDRTACEKLLGELVAFKLIFFLVLSPLVFAFAEPILRAVTPDKPEHGIAVRLLKALQVISVIEDESIVPNNSIMREFIGGQTL